MSRVLQIGSVGRLASLPLNLTHMIVECHAQVQRDVDPVAYRCSYRFEALKWQLNWLVEGCLCLFQTSRPSNKLRKEPELFAKGVVKTGGEQPLHVLILYARSQCLIVASAQPKDPRESSLRSTPYRHECCARRISALRGWDYPVSVDRMPQAMTSARGKRMLRR